MARRHSGKKSGELGAEGGALYKQIKLEVIRSLSSGRFGPDDPLPTEKELAAKHGVSIGTVRRAMDDLVAEHIVVRQQGRGTFLATLNPGRMLNRFWCIFRSDGGREIPIVQTLAFDETRARREVANALAIVEGDRVYRIINLLLLEGSPVLVDEVYLPKKLFPGLDERNFVSRETTMYGFYQSRFGVNVIRTMDRLQSVGADPKSAQRLGLAPGTPLLACIRIAYTFADKPVEFRKTRIHTGRYEYRNLIGGRLEPSDELPLSRADEAYMDTYR